MHLILEEILGKIKSQRKYREQMSPEIDDSMTATKQRSTYAYPKHDSRTNIP